MTENSRQSTQLRVRDDYTRLVVSDGGRAWRVAIDHAVGGAEVWWWSVASDAGVLLAGAEPTWAAALREALRAAERAGGSHE